MKRIFAIFLLIISYSVSADADTPQIIQEVDGANVKYKVLGGTTDDAQLLIDYKGKTYKAATYQFLNIEFVADFNGDGIGDAVVTFSDGGNGYAPSVYFVSLVNGKIVSKLLTDDWADISLSHLDDKPVAQVKTVDFTKFITFNGTDAVVVKVKPKLKPLKEITGVGAEYEGPIKVKRLIYDLNNDGKDDVIECRIWPRWGSLLCSFPLPNGRAPELDAGYDRIGVLATMKNGYHEIVGNNDDIYYFDGKGWVLQK